MSRSRSVMIGLGAVVIVGMLLVVAFSLGVYIGEHGWTWQGISLAGPGARPGPPPGGGPPGMDRPDVLGMVRRIEGSVVSLATRDGPRSVEVTPSTEVRDAQGRPVEIEAVQPGTLVAVFGHPDPGRRRLIADVILILPSREER